MKNEKGAVAARRSRESSRMRKFEGFWGHVLLGFMLM